MELKNKNYIEYKGKPLVREGDTLYYGFVNDPYILRIDIFMKDAIKSVKAFAMSKIELLGAKDKA